MAKTIRISVCSLLALLALTAAALADDTRAPQRRGRQTSDLRPSDLAPASALVYNFYSSSATDPNKQDTRINITNTNPAASAFVHLFFITGNDGYVLDAWVCLAPNGTSSFLASKKDPGMTGYIIAIASDEATGSPVSFNYLLGNVTIRLASGHRGSFNALGFPALYNGALPSENSLATLNFDGKEYAQAPKQLILAMAPSPADGASTMLVVNSLNGGMHIGATRIDEVSGVLADDAGNRFNFRGTGGYQLARILSDDFPATTPPLSEVIRTGRTGSLQIQPVQGGVGVTGAALTLNGGFNLHHLEYTNAKLVVPVFPVSCEPESE